LVPARGQLFVGVCVITAFVLFDLVDGRCAAQGPVPVGAVLDSTCDRLADGALFAALTWWCLRWGPAAHGGRGDDLAGRRVGVSYSEGACRTSGCRAGRPVERADG